MNNRADCTSISSVVQENSARLNHRHWHAAWRSQAAIQLRRLIARDTIGLVERGDEMPPTLPRGAVTELQFQRCHVSLLYNQPTMSGYAMRALMSTTTLVLAAYNI